MTHCIEMPWTGTAPRRSLVGKRAPERRPRPNIEFKSKREAELWAAIYADQSCHPGIFSVAFA